MHSIDQKWHIYNFTRFLFQINTFHMNFVFIKESWKTGITTKILCSITIVISNIAQYYFTSLVPRAYLIETEALKE